MYFFKGSLNYEQLKNTPVPEINKLIDQANNISIQIQKEIK